MGILSLKLITKHLVGEIDSPESISGKEDDSKGKHESIIDLGIN